MLEFIANHPVLNILLIIGIAILFRIAKIKGYGK